MASIGRAISRFVMGFVRWSGWRDLLARLPLPMLALAASYGVYSFALLFVPTWVAIVQAAAFELVYIGLAVVQLPPDQQKRARSISVGAVVVSVAYNTLDGLFHRRPSLLELPPLWADVVLSLLHGVPLAVLAYLVADLLLHHAPTNAKIAPSNPKGYGASEGGRPQLYTLDGLLLSVDGEETFSRELVTSRLGCSATTADRLLTEGVGIGRLERVDRGIYRQVQS